MVNIAQGMPRVLASILEEANRPMTIKELVTALDNLGREGTTYDAVTRALTNRNLGPRNIERVGRGIYKFAGALGDHNTHT